MFMSKRYKIDLRYLESELMIVLPSYHYPKIIYLASLSKREIYSVVLFSLNFDFKPMDEKVPR